MQYLNNEYWNKFRRCVSGSPPNVYNQYMWVWEHVQCTLYSIYGRESELGKVRLKITKWKHKTLIFNKS
jgi:hypothetical protein